MSRALRLCMLCSLQGGVAYILSGGTFSAHSCTFSENSAVRDGCCGWLRMDLRLRHALLSFGVQQLLSLLILWVLLITLV